MHLNRMWRLRIDALLIFWYECHQEFPTYMNQFSLLLGFSSSLALCRSATFSIYGDKLLELRQVIMNPKLKKTSDRTALFFEGCLSVDGYRAVVERHLDVEVTGLDRYGQPSKVEASGWQARILQHECDHLEGTLYVDKMVPRTFRTVENLGLPLAIGCPKLGPR